jgi:hypothetical protein
LDELSDEVEAREVETVEETDAAVGLEDRVVEPAKEKTYIPDLRAVCVFVLIGGGSSPKRKRKDIRSRRGGSAEKKTNETIETDQEVDRYFTKLKTGRAEGEGSPKPEQSAQVGQLCSG